MLFFIGLIYLSHPSYVFTIFLYFLVVLLYFLFQRYGRNHKDIIFSLGRLRLFLLRPIIVLLVPLILLIPFVSQLYSFVIVNFIPAYLSYASWSLDLQEVDKTSQLFSDTLKAYLLIAPFSPLLFISYMKSLYFSSPQSYDDLYLFRRVYVSIFVIASLAVAFYSYSANLYSINRIMSTIYPLIILFPYTRSFFDKRLFQNFFFSRLYPILVLILIFLKSSSYPN